MPLKYKEASELQDKERWDQKWKENAAITARVLTVYYAVLSAKLDLTESKTFRKSDTRKHCLQ